VSQTHRWIIVASVVILGGIGYYFAFARESKSIALAKDAVAVRDFPKAIELLKSTLGESGGNTGTLLFAARTARRGDQFGLADQYLRRYSTSGDAEIFAIERILAGIQRGELSQFMGGLRFCEKNPTHPEVPYVLEAMSQGYLKAGHIVGTLDSTERWLATGPTAADQAQAHVWRGSCFRSIGNLDTARTEARTALELAPGFLDAHVLLGDLLTSSDPDMALVHWQTASAQKPNLREAKLGIARCYRNLGETKQAFEQLKSLLDADAYDTLALIERAKLHLDSKAYDEAIRDAQKVLAFDTKSRIAMTILAQAYQATGREPEALLLRKQVQEIEEALFKRITEKVAAGLLPAPQKGTDLTVHE